MGGGSRNAGAASGEDDTGDLAVLAERLGAAVRAGAAATPEGEERAVAAFRAARDARDAQAPAPGTRLWGTRLWGARRPWRMGLPARAAFGALLASVMLGGVAMASIGALPGSTPDRPTPSPTAPGHAVPPSGRPTLPARPTVPLLRPPKPSPETPRTPEDPEKHDHHGKPKQKPKPGHEQKPEAKPEKPPKAPQHKEEPLKPRQGKGRDQGQKAAKLPHKAAKDSPKAKK
ncbi:hypothetical protein [Streptomyces ochraceiscleroticus]|uniref:Uncharacterized protein n=1 Tax=Streptomyces ochraceiscleroticus TaxID=47761 RepID=A0ABW1MFP9_9ACTN|nr:hypothetical protein [Streptomyces ochraceiscleroticus]